MNEMLGDDHSRLSYLPCLLCPPSWLFVMSCGHVSKVLVAVWLWEGGGRAALGGGGGGELRREGQHAQADKPQTSVASSPNDS